ncbi:hypothetical protein MA16_Dca020823 [Dendrobium catenatum]|uniref:Uncharacterized protein n=1 Tax=Dendrobium catenatum TaxID=906689 RepID=A0A2I0XFS6_9ASPA|nr:hypothetical protein MA16_Dca020823 [Dendrobium catenatum]
MNTNVCLLQKEVLGREPTPVELHSHIHKRQVDQQLVDERARKTYLRESQATSGEGSSGGLAEYSDYRTLSQPVGGMQHDGVYGLGSQDYAYEGLTSGGSNLANTQESLYSQHVSALTAELEQVKKAQADWHMQIQQQMEMHHSLVQMQQTQILEEMRKMREKLSGQNTAASAEEETE